MVLDLQTLINVILGTMLTAMGWFARELWDAVKELKIDLAKLREELPTEYVSKNDYKYDIERVNDKLDRIIDTLANKADRM